MNSSSRVLLSAALVIILCILRDASVGVVRAQYVVEKEAIVLSSPTELAERKFDAALADFGRPHYGSKLKGKIAFPPIDIPGVSTSTGGGSGTDMEFLGCGAPGAEALDYGSPPSSAYHDLRFPPAKPSTDGTEHVFALIDRGDCMFIEKVFNAQQAGAHAVVIVDNVYEEGVPQMVAPEGTDGWAYSLMTQISIPSVLVNKTTGDEWKRYLKQAKDTGNMEYSVVITLDWTHSLAETQGFVIWELWTTSKQSTNFDQESQEFKNAMKDVSNKLSTSGAAVFTPHYLLTSCCSDNPSIDPTACTSDVPEEGYCQDNCLNYGRYCLDDPDGDPDFGYSGADIVEQNLREITVHQWGLNKGQVSAWWDFVTAFAEDCRMEDFTFGEECANNVLEKLNIDPGEIHLLMGPHGRMDPIRDNTPNKILDDEILHKLSQKNCNPEDLGCAGEIIYVPSIVINADQYKGALNKDSVFDAICMAYVDGTEPEACPKKEVPGTAAPSSNTDSDSSSSSGSWIVGMIFTGIAVVIVTLAIGAVVYRMHMRSIMSQEVRDIMSQYMPLGGDGMNSGPSPRPSPKSDFIGGGSSTVTAEEEAY